MFRYDAAYGSNGRLVNNCGEREGKKGTSNFPPVSSIWSEIKGLVALPSLVFGKHIFIDIQKVQNLTIPKLMDRQSVLMVGQTGTGMVVSV